MVMFAPFTNARATSLLPTTLEEQFQAADAVFRGKVVRQESFRYANDGLIYTRTALRVEERFKGLLPPGIQVIHAGGTVAGIGLCVDDAPRFRVGEERLLLVKRRNDGTLYALHGEATAVRLSREKSGGFHPAQERLLGRLRRPLPMNGGAETDCRDQAVDLPREIAFLEPSGDPGGASTNGLLVDSNNVPSRFVLPDRGEAIPYLVDAAALPAGISQAQALTAVSNAMSVWAAASSFKFRFEALQNFGMSARNVANGDGKIRIQLHDNYNEINSPNILGVGGSRFTTTSLTNGNINWGPGGRTAGMEFNRGINGFAVLERTNPAMQSLATFTEVLTHEIGHVLGLAHSSDVVTNNATLTNSIMYFQAHVDGRGAQLNSHDTNVVRLAHPANTPPYAYDRVMDVTTHPSGPPNVPGINEISLRGYDLQTSSLTTFTTNATAGAGTFSLAGSLLKFAPNGYYYSPRLDPADSDYYDVLYARFSDGTNFSPYITVRTIALLDDLYPYPPGVSDGIPDEWMTTHFGNPDPAVGVKPGANDDNDGDKLSNLNEYRAGMDPTLTNSAQRITVLNSTNLQWQAKAYELYEVLGSTNLTTWTRFGNPVLPTTSTGSMSLSLTNPGRQFFRILKVP